MPPTEPVPASEPTPVLDSTPINPVEPQAALPVMPPTPPFPVQAASTPRPKRLVLIVAIGLLVAVSVLAYVLTRASSDKNSATTPNANQATNSPIDQAVKTQESEKPVAQTTTQPQAKTTPAAQPTPKTTVQTPVVSAGKTESLEVRYIVLEDGTTAQVSPVTWTMLGTTSVSLTVRLQCKAACQFKLVSDGYAVSDKTVYTKTQDIVYSLKFNPGTYVFYNHYTPGTKFAFKF